MAKTKATAEAAPPPPPTVFTEVTHTVALDPLDWYLAPWRNTPPLPRPEPRPFDLDACVGRLGCLSGGHYWNWSGIPEDYVLSREEAHFWFFAITGATKEVKAKELALSLAQQYTFDGNLTRKEIVDRLNHLKTGVREHILIPLASLLAPEELVEVLTSSDFQGPGWNPSGLALGETYSRQILPYLTPTERDKVRSQLQNKVTPSVWPSNHIPVPWALYLGALIGMPQEMRALVNSWSDDRFTQGYTGVPRFQQPQRIIFGLDDPKEVIQQMKRHKLTLYPEYLVHGFLAHTEWTGLDLVRDLILQHTDKGVIERLMEPFRKVLAPEAAPLMLEIKLTSRNAGPARQWLEQQVGNAVAGLLGTAAGRGKLAEAAIEYLREAKRKGHGELIEKQVQQAPPEVAERVRKTVLEHTEKVYPPFDDSTTPDWLKRALEETPAGKIKIPDWAAPDALPPISFGEFCLNSTQMHALLGALQKSPLSAPLPLVAAVKKHGDALGLDAFAWRLFERWLSEGAEPKEKWAFLAVGLLGGDASVLKLTPTVRTWPGESQHQRAVIGLEVLRTIGSDTALMQLNSIAQKLKFPALKKKAQTFMEAIATDKGLTRAELEDRIVPDLEMDARGSRTFDFGPRQFKLIFGENMKPMLKDDTAKLKTDLPKPAKTDDAEKAAAAVAGWKLLKKQVKEVLKTQITRLEQAMVSCRRWKPDEFESLLVKHPLMINLVRLLLWGGYDSRGKLMRTFRVTEEQDYADRDDNACNLEGVVGVGIVHPLHLSDEEKAGWGEVFSDYELLAPFPQLGRRVQKLQPGEEKETKITRYDGFGVEALTLIGVMDRTNWMRGPTGDGGVIHEFTRYFLGANITAVLCVEDGIPLGFLEGWNDQKITEVYFLEGQVEGHHRWKKDKTLFPLGEVDPVVISEVLDILEALKAKGR